MLDWESSLTRLFAATVNQQTLEEAAELMVSVSARDPGYHSECLVTLNEAIQACDRREQSVIAAINKSGYRVASTEEAKELLQEFLDIYEQRYRQAAPSQ